MLTSIDTRRLGTAIAAIGVTALLAGQADAHHSFPGAYDVQDQRILEGMATDFLFRNPHAFIVLAVQGDDGSTAQWYLELPPRWALERRGITDDTVQAGDRLLVTCNPARDGGLSCGLGQRGGFYRESDGYLYGADPRASR